MNQKTQPKLTKVTGSRCSGGGPLKKSPVPKAMTTKKPRGGLPKR
jgi:hypothetical protein